MWQELTLVHRTPDLRNQTPVEKGHLWRTCLRELHFLEPGNRSPGGRSGAAAHRLLVEICSGLHSPLFGETEVLGQFRAFRDSQDWSPLWDSFFDAVEEDVRKLRRAHLKNLGSQSYGSLARRHLPADRQSVILGAGLLAKDLLPWLSSFHVTVAARNPEKASRELGVKAVALQDLSLAPGTSYLLAAPLANECLEQIWQKNPAGLVLDFRGDGEFTTPPPHVERYLGLRALYAELESAKLSHARKRAEALDYAAELSRRREQAVVHRPYGWEDAFA